MPASTLTVPKVEIGISTYLGVGLAVAGGVGTIIAALHSNDTATVTAGVTTITTALATIGGRTSQALELARRVARGAAPIVDALAAADAMHDSVLRRVNSAVGDAEPVVDALAGEDAKTAAVAAAALPSDDEEFAGPQDPESRTTPDPA
jgi:hypothetical protein